MTDDYAPADLVSDIKRHGENLSEWEQQFVRDISSKLSNGWTLSDKQIAKLKAIHEDRVG